MLINGQHAEELRVAVVEGGVLESFQIEVAEAGQERGNIYRGIVANIEPSLDAAFIDYGNEKHGFLTSHDVVRQAYHRSPKQDGRRPAIDEVLERGKSVLVQVARDAVGTKGSALTTNISLPGRFLVVTPFDGSCGLSRKIEDEEMRKQLKEKAKGLALPEGYGYIIRTSAADQTKTALKGDVAGLLRLCKRILAEPQGKGPRLLYDDQDMIVQALRDYLDAAIEEVLVDDEKLLERAAEYLKATMPRSKLKLSHYQGRVPLFSRYNLEPQIDSIYKRTVLLQGGGSIVIDHTEALTAIDVNSGKNTRGTNQEETAYKTNLAAAEEVARQLRLRNIGGLVVVDFIDMRARRHRATIEKTQRDEMKRDKARSSVGRISSNGLLEINRQRVKQSLVQRMHRTCPTCQGVGLLATTELRGLRLLRRIEARAATGRMRKVRISLHPELADAVQNQRRRQLVALETEFGLEVEVLAASHLHRSDEEIEWIAGEGPADSKEGQRNGRATGSQRGKPARQTAKPLTALETTDRRPADTDESEQVAAEGSAPESGGSGSNAAQSAAEEGNGEPRGRRRRRRSRRRKRREPPAEAQSAGAETRGLSQTPTDVDVALQREVSGHGGSSDERAEGRKPAALASTPTEPELVLPAAQPEGEQTQATGANPESEAAAPSTGRRRSRRRGGRRNRATRSRHEDGAAPTLGPETETQRAAAAPTTEPAPVSAPAAESPAGSPPTSEPARVSAPVSEPSPVSPPASEASEPTPPVAAAPAEGEEAPSSDKKPKPARRSRRSPRPRRPRADAGGGSEKSTGAEEASSAVAAESASGSTAEGPPQATEGEAKPKKPARTRSRRKAPTRTKAAATQEPAADATASEATGQPVEQEAASKPRRRAPSRRRTPSPKTAAAAKDETT